MAGDYTDLHRNVMDEPMPHNIDAEISVLGAMMFDTRCLPQVMSVVTADDFYSPSHQLIFKAICDLYHSNIPIDIVTVSDFLDKVNIMGEVGGRSYLMGLFETMTIAEQAPYFARMVRGLATRRHLFKNGYDIMGIAQETKDSMEAITESQSLLIQVAEREIGGVTVSHVSPIISSVLKEVEERKASPSSVFGLSTGWLDLDGMTGGLQKSDLIIVAARPSMGKTAFMLNMVENCVVKEGKPAVIFSLEMSREQLVQRMISGMSGVSMTIMRSGFITDIQHEKVIEAGKILSRAPLYIEDQSAISVNRINIVAKQIAMQVGGALELIAIDYLQLMGIERGHKLEEGNQKVSYISSSLKGLAKELSVPVVALSQLSRAVEGRVDKKPQLSDLRDSGSIEQDADMVAFIYRDDYYKKDSDKRGVAEIIIAKQRNGPVGDVELIWNHHLTRFSNRIPTMIRTSIPG